MSVAETEPQKIYTLAKLRIASEGETDQIKKSIMDEQLAEYLSMLHAATFSSKEEIDGLIELQIEAIRDGEDKPLDLKKSYAEALELFEEKFLKLKAVMTNDDCRSCGETLHYTSNICPKCAEDNNRTAYEEIRFLKSLSNLLQSAIDLKTQDNL